jgi:hypothetical protein
MFLRGARIRTGPARKLYFDIYEYMGRDYQLNLGGKSKEP